jgi:hypothetical protein
MFKNEVHSRMRDEIPSNRLLLSSTDWHTVVQGTTTEHPHEHRTYVRLEDAVAFAEAEARLCCPGCGQATLPAGDNEDVGMHRWHRGCIGRLQVRG